MEERRKRSINRKPLSEETLKYKKKMEKSEKVLGNEVRRHREKEKEKAKEKRKGKEQKRGKASVPASPLHVSFTWLRR